jgi:hypothetical protein
MSSTSWYLAMMDKLTCSQSSSRETKKYKSNNLRSSNKYIIRMLWANAVLATWTFATWSNRCVIKRPYSLSSSNSNYKDMSRESLSRTDRISRSTLYLLETISSQCFISMAKYYNLNPWRSTKTIWNSKSFIVMSVIQQINNILLISKLICNKITSSQVLCLRA